MLCKPNGCLLDGAPAVGARRESVNIITLHKFLIEQTFVCANICFLKLAKSTLARRSGGSLEALGLATAKICIRCLTNEHNSSIINNVRGMNKMKMCYCADTIYGEVNIIQEKNFLENLKNLLTNLLKNVIIKVQ